MIRSLTSAMTTVRTRTDAIENRRLAVRSSDIVGLTMWMASLVSSVRTASSGLMIMFTLNAPATAANPTASPASGCRPTLRKAAPAKRDQHHIAGIGGDARQNADECDDVNQCPARRDGHELSDQRIHQAGFLGHADAHHGDDQQADCGETQEIRHEPGVDVANSVCRQQAVGDGGCGLDLVRIRIDDLVGNSCPQHVQNVREHQHECDKDREISRPGVGRCFPRARRCREFLASSSWLLLRSWLCSAAVMVFSPLLDGG